MNKIKRLDHSDIVDTDSNQVKKVLERSHPMKKLPLEVQYLLLKYRNKKPFYKQKLLEQCDDLCDYNNLQELNLLFMNSNDLPHLKN